MAELDPTLFQGQFESRILIVDDQLANVYLLEGILGAAGYTNLVSTTNPLEVIPLTVSHEPDLILLDLMMPQMNGFQIMEQLRLIIPKDHFLPILVLTADITDEARRKALSGGASDFLTKPFNHVEVLLRIKNLLRTRHLHNQLLRQNQILEEKVRERTAELYETQIEVLERLAVAAEYRDDDTGRHTARVGRIAALLAESLELPEDEVELIRRAAPLHDVGKIGISDNILLKPGKLTVEEFKIMQMHTIIGARILSGGSSELTKLAEQIALLHHERWDGTGYPQGLAEEAIPIAGRIVALADVFDALTHERPYKAAWPEGEAIAEIERQSGRQFDPRVVEVFLKVLDLLPGRMG